MKKLSVALLLICAMFLIGPPQADSWDFLRYLYQWKAISSGAGGGGETADHYFKLDAAGGTDTAQVYDEITASWVGALANLGAFVTGYDGKAYEANASSEHFTTPASIVGGTTELTVRFRYMANNAGNNTVFPLHHHNSYGADRLYFNHNTDGTNGSVTYRANSGTTAVITFTKPSDASWHEVYLAVDMSAGNIHVYIDGSLAGSTTSNANVVDWGAQSDDSKWCHIVNTVANRYCVIDELRIYYDIVTP